MIERLSKQKGFLILSLLCLFAVGLTGCSQQWRVKFIRKRKEIEPPKAILTYESNAQSIYPPAVRYREHFAYWKSWHSELLDSLGQIRKRDVRYLDGSIGELRSMAALLSGPPAEHLQRILIELDNLANRWEQTSEPWRVPSATRTRLERLGREIDRDFSYSKVKSVVPDR